MTTTNKYLVILSGNSKGATLRTDYAFFEGSLNACKALVAINGGCGRIMSLGFEGEALGEHKHALDVGRTSKLIKGELLLSAIGNLFDMGKGV